MAKKISQLDPASGIVGTDLIPIANLGEDETQALTVGALAELDAFAERYAAIGEGGGGGGVTLEEVRDDLATVLVAGPNIAITPDDGANTITITATSDVSIDHGLLTGREDNDHPQYALGTDIPPLDPFLYQQWINSGKARLVYWNGAQFVEVAGSPPVFVPGDYQLSDLGGFVQPAQGGFGADISNESGDPTAARELIGAASETHIHRDLYTVITDAATYVLSPADEGRCLLFDIDGDAAISVTLPNQATEADWASGMGIELLAFSSGTITIAPAASVIVDGVTATSFALVQHGRAKLTRMPANNYWDFSGRKV